MMLLMLNLTLVFCFCSLTSASKIRTEGVWYRDELNRTRLFHGVNYVTKSGNHLPTITKAEVTKLKTLGANVVRLGVMIDGLFPTSATPDPTYLPAIKNIVDMLWKSGIYSVLDLHQDVLSDKFCGEGIPPWMMNVSDLHALSFPLPAAFSNISKADPATGSYLPTPDCTSRGLLKFIGWSQFYMTDANGKAWQKIFHNESLVGHMIDIHWRMVAKYFNGHPGILAYEMMNEPWVGDHVADPLLLLESGRAELKNVGSYMQRIHDVIREVDDQTMTLYAPAEVNNRFQRHVGYKAGFLPGSPMAFHVYCITGTDGPGPVTPITKDICHFNDGFQLRNRRDDLKRLNAPGFVTEFGAVDDVLTGREEMRFVLEHIDGQGTGMPLSWIMWDHNLVDKSSDLYRLELARSYPTAVAGVIVDFSFNVTTGHMSLLYTPNSVNASTELYLSSKYQYKNGFNVVATPSSCCVITKTENGASLIVRKIPATGPIDVQVTRK
jgi:endoglycosylceramidase